MKVGPGLLTTALLCATSNNGVHSLITEITPDELAAGIQSNFFRVVADVRRQDEWDLGHIVNATFLQSLASAGTPYEITNASALAGCENCNVAVYCNSGVRADRAVAYLAANGFNSLYDAAGIKQWLDSGRELVNIGTREAPCVVQPEARCAALNETTVTDPAIDTVIDAAMTSTPDTSSAGSLPVFVFSTIVSGLACATMF